MTSIYFSQVKKILSNTECVIGFFQNQYGIVIMCLQREIKGSQAKPQRGYGIWAGP